MIAESTFEAIADAVLALHVAVLGFVVGGLALIVAGGLRGWAWTRGRLFRALHVGAIAVVVAESWLRIPCPLTTVELWLRERADKPFYAGSFVGHWLQRLLYWDVPEGLLALAYTAFGALVAAAWWYFPPRRDGE